nr:uncharacterized protein LOC111512028 [Leptinotarsa decemlineata]
MIKHIEQVSFTIVFALFVYTDVFCDRKVSFTIMDDIKFEHGFTLQEALEIAYSEDIDAIYIEPPEPNVLTDEDSGDEDCGGTIDNLSGRQLRARAEVKFANKNNVEEDIIHVEKCTNKIRNHLFWLSACKLSQ